MATQKPKKSSKDNKAPADTKPTKAQKVGFLHTHKWSLLLFVLAIALNINTLQNDYVMDDGLMFVNNTQVKRGLVALPEIFTTPYHYGNYHTQATGNSGLVIDDLYRPLSVALFAVEYQLFGFNPMPGHFFNILIYAACILALFRVLKKLLPGNDALAFVATLLFACHPIHTEVVTNIKSADELLSFLFGILTLDAMIIYAATGKTKDLWIGALFYMLSLLGKETTITLVVLLPILLFFWDKENRNRKMAACAVIVATALVYMGLRFWVLLSHHAYNPAGVTFMDNALVSAPGFASRLATEIYVLGYYIRLLLLPYPLICDYGFGAVPFQQFSSPLVWASALVYVALLISATYLVLRNKMKPLAIGIIFYLITIAVFSNIFILLASEMAERFLFLPSVGFCIATAWALIHFMNGSATPEKPISRRMLYVLIPVCLVFSLLTIARNAEWKDNFTLFRADVAKSPNDYRLHKFLGDVELDLSRNPDNDRATNQNYFEDGLQQLQHAVVIYPGDEKAQTILAGAFLVHGQTDSAEAHCRVALAHGLLKDNAFNTLGNIAMLRHRLDTALYLFRLAMITNPADCHYPGNMGLCYLLLNQPDSSYHYNQLSLSINPDYNIAIMNMAVASYRLSKMDTAKLYTEKARRFNPGFDPAKVQLPQCGFYQ